MIYFANVKYDLKNVVLMKDAVELDSNLTTSKNLVPTWNNGFWQAQLKGMFGQSLIHFTIGA